MSRKIVLSQAMFLAVEFVERSLKLLGEGEYRFKDATFGLLPFASTTVGERPVTHMVEIKGRVYLKGQKPKKIKAEIYVRAHPKGGAAPEIDMGHAQILRFEGSKYYAYLHQDGITLNVWYSDEHSINPGYNPPQLRLVAKEK